VTLTVHLAFVREDDLAAATGRIDRERLLEALFDVRAPDALGVRGCQVLVILHRKVASVTAVMHIAILHEKHSLRGARDASGITAKCTTRR
jgi:hypothetical protein